MAAHKPCNNYFYVYAIITIKTKSWINAEYKDNYNLYNVLRVVTILTGFGAFGFTHVAIKYMRWTY